MLSHMSVLECRSVLGAGAGLTIDNRALFGVESEEDLERAHRKHRAARR